MLRVRFYCINFNSTPQFEGESGVSRYLQNKIAVCFARDKEKDVIKQPQSFAGSVTEPAEVDRFRSLIDLGDDKELIKCVKRSLKTEAGKRLSGSSPKYSSPLRISAIQSATKSMY